VAQESMGNESVQVHEAAHGWFGNGVRLRCWEDFVLSEGTASYLAERVLLQVGTTRISSPVLLGYLGELEVLRADKQPHIVWPQSCGKIDILKDGLYSRAPYVRGALFYEALQRRLGRDPVDLALRTFYQRYAGQAAGMRDMLNVIAEVTGYDPQACAATWLVDPAVPVYAPCPP
jgi:aminopeptidase N